VCKHEQSVGSNIYGQEKKFRLKDFFDAHWDAYVKSPKHFIRPEVYKAVSAIRVCRTAKLGIEQYVCEECGEVSEIHHSCKNRFCPTCSWQDTMKWADKLQYRMFDLKHRHVVFTLPHKLIGLIQQNQGLLLSVLMQVSADVFKDWMLEKYAIKPGIISVLHTYGEKKNAHFHVHMIVSWGGIDVKTKRLEEIKGEYVKYGFLQQKYRAKFEDRLVELYDTGKLQHRFKDRYNFLRFLKDINEKNWHLNIDPPMANPLAVIRYIGRYSKRACLSEYKITKMEGEQISFEYKDYKNEDIYGQPIVKELEFHYSDFFPLLLQHVPFKNFRLVRYYGFYATASRIAEQYLFNPDAPETESELELKEVIEEAATDYITTDDLRVCSTCNINKTYIYTIFEKDDTGFFKKQEERLLENKEFREQFMA